MKVFIVFAHPEPQSFGGSLRQAAVKELEAQGHEVQVSDLYAIQWKSQVDRSDFPKLPAEARLRVAYASGEATFTDTLTDDVKREQEKLMWADTVILQFPLWWYSMPAILKGWVDRVYSAGFGYGNGEHNDKRWGDRYGEGKMLGKRAMVVVTVGGWREYYSPRGICGPIDDLLFPITHGILYYTGFEVLPSFVVYQSDRASEAVFSATAEELRQRLRELSTAQPIPFRPQNGGEYEVPTLVLKPEVEVTSQSSGFLCTLGLLKIHMARRNRPKTPSDYSAIPVILLEGVVLGGGRLALDVRWTASRLQISSDVQCAQADNCGSELCKLIYPYISL